MLETAVSPLLALMQGVIDDSGSSVSMMNMMADDECGSGFWFDCNSIVWEVEEVEDISSLTLLAYSLMGAGAGSRLTGSSIGDFVSNEAWATYIAEALNAVDLLTYIWAFSMWLEANNEPNMFTTFRSWRIGLLYAAIASFCTTGSVTLSLIFNANKAA